MSSVLFEYTNRLGKRIQKLIPHKYARAKAIELAEDALFDRITDVTYTITIDGETVTKALDYYNDIY